MRIKLKRLAHVLLASVVVLLFVLVAVPARAQAAGSLRVVTDSDDEVTYKAYRIADQDAMPQDGQFDWDALSEAGLLGTELPGRSLGKGRPLVEAVSTIIAKDGGGTGAVEMEAFIAEEALYTELTAVKIDNPAGYVGVSDGWWLLTSEGRRPILCWVAGNSLDVGDKMSVPSFEKEILGDEGAWGSWATASQMDVVEQRISIQVPNPLPGGYRLVVNDAWDEALSLEPQTMSVTVVRADGSSADVTSTFTLDSGSGWFALSTDDLAESGVGSGETVVVQYGMRVVSAKLGAEGMGNRAWLTYPTHKGEARTVPSETRVYSFGIRVEKLASGTTTPLAGATFGIRNVAGEWMQGDGSFGAEASRAVLTSGQDGFTELSSGLGAGSYELVELEAPSGYALPQQAVMPFALGAQYQNGELSLTAQVTGPELTSVKALEGEVTVRVFNEKKPAVPGFLRLPKTGDELAELLPYVGGAVLVGAGLIVVALRLRRKD